MKMRIQMFNGCILKQRMLKQRMLKQVSAFIRWQYHKEDY